jgi:oxalate decarboxylase/phosphoglucose isomerase-like protein (cupin superfamily)
VFTSNSWSANIVGKKRWLLFPPGQESFLKNMNGDLIYDLNSTEFDNASNCIQHVNKSLKSFEIIQEEGQIIFVPSGWYHQVWNLVSLL